VNKYEQSPKNSSLDRKLDNLETIKTVYEQGSDALRNKLATRIAEKHNSTTSLQEDIKEGSLVKDPEVLEETT